MSTFLLLGIASCNGGEKIAEVKDQSSGKILIEFKCEQDSIRLKVDDSSGLEIGRWDTKVEFIDALIKKNGDWMAPLAKATFEIAKEKTSDQCNE